MQPIVCVSPSPLLQHFTQTNRQPRTGQCHFTHIAQHRLQRTCITVSYRAADKWRVGNRGVCIKIQSYAWHAVKLWQRYTWNWRKSRTKSLFYSQAVNVCQRYHKQHRKPRPLVPSAPSKGSANRPERPGCRARLGLEQRLGREQRWSCCTSFRDHAVRRSKGKKRNPNSCRTGLEKTRKIFCSPSERSYQ